MTTSEEQLFDKLQKPLYTVGLTTILINVDFNQWYKNLLQDILRDCIIPEELTDVDNSNYNFDSCAKMYSSELPFRYFVIRNLTLELATAVVYRIGRFDQKIDKQTSLPIYTGVFIERQYN